MEELGRSEFQVTASLEIEGKVYKGVKSVPAKMVIGKAQAKELCTYFADETSNGTCNILCSLECK